MPDDFQRHHDFQRMMDFRRNDEFLRLQRLNGVICAVACSQLPAGRAILGLPIGHNCHIGSEPSSNRDPEFGKKHCRKMGYVAATIAAHGLLYHVASRILRRLD